MFSGLGIWLIGRSVQLSVLGSQLLALFDPFLNLDEGRSCVKLDFIGNKVQLHCYQVIKREIQSFRDFEAFLVVFARKVELSKSIVQYCEILMRLWQVPVNIECCNIIINSFQRGTAVLLDLFSNFQQPLSQTTETTYSKVIEANRFRV